MLGGIIPLALAFALATGTAGGCGDKGAGAGAGQHAGADARGAAPSAVTIQAGRAGSDGLVFRYLDPASGAVRTATSVDAIPEPARAGVVVFDDAHPTPAGWDLVVDLSAGLPAQATPRQGFQLDPKVAQAHIAASPGPASASGLRGGLAAPSSAGRGAHRVTVFTKPGCGFCRKARRFLRAQKIPFSEYNLETDPSATKKLRQLANRAGLSPAALQGVPIIFVDDEVVVGFDEPAVRRLLGL